MVTVTASEARQTLPAQLDRVEAGEDVAITRHGRVVAVLVSPEKLRSRRSAAAWAAAEEIGEMLEAARDKPLKAALTAERAEELVAEVRRSRDAR